MIPCRPCEQPPDFDRRCAEPGRNWLAANPDARRPHDYWSVFKPQLADAFANLCAYSAMYEPVGTVDHFVSWNEDRSKAYEWTNYRFAAGWINSSKSKVPSHRILDPFEVEEGYFEILLPSLQMVVASGVPRSMRDRCEFVLNRLHLRDDERVMRQRREWYRMYQDGELDLEGLEKKAPLIAAAIRKQVAGKPLARL